VGLPYNRITEYTAVGHGCPVGRPVEALSKIIAEKFNPDLIKNA
jgi:hypothetical protein